MAIEEENQTSDKHSQDQIGRLESKNSKPIIPVQRNIVFKSTELTLKTLEDAVSYRNQPKPSQSWSTIDA